MLAAFIALVIPRKL